MTHNSKDLAVTFAGTFVLWALLDRGATMLGSLRGEFGVLLALATIGVALAIEIAAGRRPIAQAMSGLGLRLGDARALMAAVLLCGGLLCFFPLFGWWTGARIGVRGDWVVLGLGIFAQAGIAEEVAFRGFLFRRLRATRSFWRAATLAAIPFVAIHLLLFLTMDPAIAAAALVVSVSLSFPLAWLFERGGNSIWAPALVHAVVQGSIKLVEMDVADFATAAVWWMVLCCVAAWAAFLLRPWAYSG